MCARYVFYSGRSFGDEFGVVAVPDLTPRYNIAPSQLVPAVIKTPAGKAVTMFQWGLVPSWSKDPSIGSKLINARAETITEKPSFRTAFKRRRCLIPADGFYEWKGPSSAKQPYFITCDHHPFAFAGLWEDWEGVEGVLQTCTIVTTNANELLSTFHDRMPVILEPEQYEAWLDVETPQPILEGLLDSYPADRMKMSAVSKAVGNPRFDDQSLIEPIACTNLFDQSV